MLDQLKAELTSQESRSIPFKDREHNRYWWFRATHADYVPPVFDFLSEDEWNLLSHWYDDTEKKFTSPGECSVPAISLLFGLIMGNRIGRVVQLGHYVGFSTLLIGWMLRRMNCQNGLVSFDIDSSCTEYTQSFLHRANLSDYVNLIVGDSADESNVHTALDYLQGKPELIFIDSSHQYQHTLDELNLWYQHLQPGGFILMHDVSKYAQSFDSTKKGGVLDAFHEWLSDTQSPSALLVNQDNVSTPVSQLIYKDGCGLGVVQKPL